MLHLLDAVHVRPLGPRFGCCCCFFSSRCWSGPQVHAKAVAGDEHARAAIRDVANGLARAITTVTAVLDPDAVTLGGYVLDLADLFLDDMRAAMRRYSSP
ncbi:ROK family protein [Actinopolymorpha pittospori]